MNSEHNHQCVVQGLLSADPYIRYLSNSFCHFQIEESLKCPKEVGKGEVEEAMLSLRVATNSTTQLAPVALLKWDENRYTAA